jgi:hypothetical protein
MAVSPYLFSLMASGFFVCSGLCYNRRAPFLDTDVHR